MTEKSAPCTGSEKSVPAKSQVSVGDAGKDACTKDSQTGSVAKLGTTGTVSHSSTKKCRKVNHGRVPLAQHACNRDLDTVFGHWLARRLEHDFR